MIDFVLIAAENVERERTREANQSVSIVYGLEWEFTC